MLTGTASSERDEPDEERAVEQRQRAEVVLARVPVVGEHRAEALLAEPRQRFLGGRVRDQPEDDQHHEPAEEREPPEQVIAGDAAPTSTAAETGRVLSGLGGFRSRRGDRAHAGGGMLREREIAERADARSAIRNCCERQLAGTTILLTCAFACVSRLLESGA